MKKRIVTIALVIALLATCFAGTYAYLTDFEQATNEFVIGNVAIDLYETVAHLNALNDELQPEEILGKGSDVATQYTYTSVMPGDTMKKVVTVENTGDNEAYIALTIKQENYGVFNDNIDAYYEPTVGKDTAAMEELIDAIFCGDGWDLGYIKDTNNNPLRYMMIDPGKDITGNVEVLGYGYTNASKPQDGIQRWNYAGAIFDNVKSYMGTEMDGNFDTLPGDFSRMWVIYLKVAPGASFTVDLTIMCPNFIDNNSIKAFDNMELDIKAFAIQAQGLEAKTAFAELFKQGFAY